MYRVEFSEPTNEADRLQRRFSEETARAVGSIVFINGQSAPYKVLVEFDDGQIPGSSTPFESAHEAIAAVYDDPHAEELVKKALNAAFAQDYDRLTELIDKGVGIEYAVRSWLSN